MLFRHWVATAAAILLPLTIVLTLVLHPLLTREENSNVTPSAHTNKQSTDDDDDVLKNVSALKLKSSLRIVERASWLALPSTHEPLKILQPVPWVIISHTATEVCKTMSECVLLVRRIQSFDQEIRGWDDIAYNFLIGRDGSIFSGRGWDFCGAHTQGYNNHSMTIAFIGTFNDISPSKNQMVSCQRLVELGVQTRKLAENYILLGQRQLTVTSSPGDKLFNEIRTWPHFHNNMDMSLSS